MDYPMIAGMLEEGIIRIVNGTDYEGFASTGEPGPTAGEWVHLGVVGEEDALMTYLADYPTQADW